MDTLTIQPHPDGDSGALTALPEEQRSRVSDALGAAYSEGTRRVYDSHWASWLRWADNLGAMPLPAAPVHVAAYIADRAEEGWRPATMQIALSAIAFATGSQGWTARRRTRGSGPQCAAWPEVWGAARSRRRA